MAEVVAPGSQDTQTQQHQRAVPHGLKRPADSSLENEQRLSKRFDLLNLVDGKGTRLYIPVAGSSDAAAQPAASKPVPKPVAPVTGQKRRTNVRSPTMDESMLVDETPHRVYIHDLAAELSDIESDEETPIFLSDIEKHIAKIPKHVLTGPELKPRSDNQLVLYNVPSSLTVPEEQDRVRKAIFDARARIREKQANPIGEPTSASRTSLAAESRPGPDSTMEIESDPDAMDID